MTKKERLEDIKLSGFIRGLKRFGKGYKAMCPMHKEMKAHLLIDGSLKGYKCSGCGRYGLLMDLVDFLYLIEEHVPSLLYCDGDRRGY